MKKLASIILALFAIGASAQSVTPNLNLATPAFGSSNWNVPIVNNFVQLDLFLSGHLPLPALSVTGQLLSPQLTTWNSNATYVTGDLVIYLGTAYVALATSTNVLPTTTADWTSDIVSSGGGGLAAIPNDTLLGNNSGATAIPSALTAAQISAILGLGTAATQSASAFDAAGAASAAQITAENFTTSSLAGAINPSSVGATTPGPIAATTLHATGAITSTVANGTAPLVVSSTTQVANLNAATAGSAASLSAASALPSGTTATTQTAGDNTTKVATDAFVAAAVTAGGGGGDNVTSPNGTLSVGGTSTATTIDLSLTHPNTWTGQQTLVSPILTGIPTVPTAPAGTNTTQAASTAFVLANAGGGGGPSSSIGATLVFSPILMRPGRTILLATGQPIVLE
jgi:hypothetical protein